MKYNPLKTETDTYKTAGSVSLQKMPSPFPSPHPGNSNMYIVHVYKMYMSSVALVGLEQKTNKSLLIAFCMQILYIPALFTKH
jgi:hypothetical protein